MNSITEIISKIPAIIGVGIEAQRRTPALFPLKEITYNMQMCYYWLKEANDELKGYVNSVELSEDTDEKYKLVIPTLLGTPEQLNFMHEHITELAKGTWEYVDSVPLPASVKYKLEQSYNSTMIALFNTKLSTTYYEQLARG